MVKKSKSGVMLGLHRTRILAMSEGVFISAVFLPKRPSNNDNYYGLYTYMTDRWMGGQAVRRKDRQTDMHTHRWDQFYILDC